MSIASRAELVERAWAVRDEVDIQDIPEAIVDATLAAVVEVLEDLDPVVDDHGKEAWPDLSDGIDAVRALQVAVEGGRP